MVNTHILANEFGYIEPRTIDEALQYLADYGEKTRIIAGGTDLLVQMKTGKICPQYLLNISKIPALRYLIKEKSLRIGALTAFRELERSQVIRERYTALFEAAKSVSSVQIKNMGTVGGNLCNASPAADSAPPLLVFGGKVKLVDVRQERTLPLEKFFIGPGKTVLTPEEFLLEVEVDGGEDRTGSAFKKMGRVSADLSKVSVAVAIVRKGNVCEECRIALGAVAGVPMRARSGEEILKGEKMKESLIENASLQVAQEISPIDDIRSTAWYRKEVAKVIVQDAIRLAWERAAL
ncbi:MAG: xanthine dehydrogenase family protein subunit M [Thermodesulfobacteriota bacterium]|nr:xanthine dehydrogenase family protein subunit M [Thermodesulfobacteriota bacterium]